MRPALVRCGVKKVFPCALLDKIYLFQMAKKLYVGNLPYTTANEDLASTFSEYGEVTSATVMIDRMTGRSRGFGFVEMANDDEADKAVEALNGKDFGGRSLVVNEARPMGERPPRHEGGGFHGGRR
jgi:RNA recognition motif-containing protein